MSPLPPPDPPVFPVFSPVQEPVYDPPAPPPADVIQENIEVDPSLPLVEGVVCPTPPAPTVIG